MTFRKKLMMRNASWHFRGTSQQPPINTHRRGEGWGLGTEERGRRGQDINFAVSIMTVVPFAVLLKFRQDQTGTGWGCKESHCVTYRG
jgi:hypothetical protein